ncbi:MAG: class I SAM-dependent methyltransferase [Acidimicrobiales bacterium]
MSTASNAPRTFGVGRGKVFPAARAKSLLNPARRLVQSPRRTVARMGLRRDDLVLEVGCGPGYFTPELGRAVGAGLVIAFDVQFEMLKLTGERLSTPTNVIRVQGDAADLPLGAASIDAAVVILMLGELPDRARCLVELARVVRPGGQLVMCESRRDSDFIALEELVGLVEPHGFRLGSRRGIGWEYTARFARLG